MTTLMATCPTCKRGAEVRAYIAGNEVLHEIGPHQVPVWREGHRSVEWCEGAGSRVVDVTRVRL